MTDIITFDVKKPIENSINELVKNLSNDIEKKIREDITNNLLTNITTTSIYGLDDIKDFGKFSSESIVCQNNILQLTHFEMFKKINENYYIKENKENEYPILNTYVNMNCGENYYISNIIDGLLLSNDDILLLSLFSIKLSNPYIPHYKPFPQFIDYLVQNNYIETGYISVKNKYTTDKKLDKSLKRYFASVHDNKIKAFEFDKLLKKYKELEVIWCITFNNNKKELDESKEIIIDLENKNKNLEEEINKQSKKLKEIKEIEILNLEEEYNKLFTVFTETKEENIKLSDKWLILKDETIAKFEEDNYKLRMEKDKLIKNNNELKKDLEKILKENNNLIEENKNVNSKIIELIEDIKKHVK